MTDKLIKYEVLTLEGADFKFEKIIEASNKNQALDKAYPEIPDHKVRCVRKLKEKEEQDDD